MMEDDDLEYDITFPSPVHADVASAEEIGFNNRREPVVILLGWLGCREKHLSKYGQIYDQRGCITIRYTSPRDVAFFNMEKLDDIACKILDLLKDYSIEENPVIFHIFSNNGSYVYSHIVKVLTNGDERYRFIKVCGVVIDSAPGKPRLMNAAKAYSMSLHVNPFLKYIAFFGVISYLWFTGIISRLRSMFYPEVKQKSNFFLFDNMAGDSTRWPMLFLYSKSDSVIMYYDIEDMMSQRRALGVHVSSVCWDDTSHVAHLLVHKDEYERACEDFLEYCLGGECELILDEEEEFETEEDYLLAKKE
ncbi:transmembrane protein 53-like [Dreissena polymorpha]|uniref:Transmembrane protein 53 n=1 Tax=Dreissena polymorpha TaxID=45954 RepID=A0A9D3Y6P1_DREPO|nr:transmembrane protein 53-like [Dreissena polymorpha]KAH3693231.1 hypothetical protein DPMN_192634 [Dreissena polymorpha]